jgi:hypothetical protein
MEVSEAELQQVLQSMRAGGTIQVGGSRAHSTLGIDREGWYWEHFDEGRVERSPASEADLRKLAASDPTAMTPLLRQPHWNGFRQALADNDTELACKHLGRWLQYGDPFDHGKIWLAILDWPARVPGDEIVRLIREKIRDYTAYHLYMDAHGWRKGAEASASALAFLAQLLAMVDGEAENIERLREGFERLA